ncbi:MAG: hypothetical protein ACHRXM_35820 [Isosphaerales bacterium]
MDGRDFLFSVFQRGPTPTGTDVILRAFGKRALEYADWAWESEETAHRIIVCKLAVLDEQVIKAHAKNEVVLGGRYRTVFRSAFVVRYSDPPHKVTAVAPPSQTRFQTDVMLDAVAAPWRT